MKKLIYLGCVVTVIAFTSACKHKTTVLTNDGSQAIDTANAPVMSFASTTYDFGKIKEGEKVSFNFKFTNTGKSPLIIQSAAASCGCTVPDYPHEPVAPGDSSQIKVVFNSEGKEGMQNKVVSITSNAIPTSAEINFVGEVLPSNK